MSARLPNLVNLFFTFKLDAVQFSLLSGRISIKDFRYHGSCQSIRAVKCSITWRYWLWRTRDVSSSTENTRSLNLLSRIHLSLEGAEWSLYNRTSAYDEILSRIRESGGGADIINELSPSNSAPYVNENGITVSKKSTLTCKLKIP